MSNLLKVLRPALLVLLASCAGSNPLDPYDRVSVSVSGDGDGGGVISSRDATVNIGCRVANGTRIAVDGRCDNQFADAGAGGSFSLLATPDEGSVFESWSGCTSVRGPVCELAFSQNQSPSPSFAVVALFRRANAVTLAYDTNLLQNPGFETAILVQNLPTVTGRWQGDSAASVPANAGFTPRSGSRAMRFLTSGPGLPSLTGVSSQQWQIVDISGFSADVDASRVRVTGSAWYYRVQGDAETDRLFAFRILGFSGAPSGFALAYVTVPSPRLTDETASVTTNSASWTQIARTLLVPPGTRYLVVELYAYEDVMNDATFPEFDGHWVDDASLVLTRVP